MPDRPLLPIFAGPRRHVLAFNSAGGFNPLALEAPDLIKWVESKDPRAIGSWSEIGPEEYGRAFAVAQTAGLDVIDDLYFAFADTIERGGTEVDFAKLVIPTLRQKGWLGGVDDRTIARRVDLIYDTNLRFARGAGQWEQVQRAKSYMPYLRGATAQDMRVRRPPKSPDSDHTAFQGIILPVDHPFWRRWWTPLGFRCRCAIIPMSRSQLARYPGGVTSDADLAIREARLGQPIFRAPGAGTYQQIADMAERVNDSASRMPGRPALVVAEQRRAGASLWAIETAGTAIDALIARLFG